MTQANLMTRSAIELAKLVKVGEVSARELVETALRQIEANPALNAFNHVDADGALALADQIKPGDPRPLAGVPIAIKDLTAVAGQPLTNGSNLFGDYRPTEDAYVVRRLRAAGCVIVGRTNTPEFGLMGVTEPRRFGPTRNPWNLDRTPGGSSGGAAAAVAGGLVPVAHATDGGGSTRVPAACCGLVGLKGSRGRISHGPALGESFTSNHGVVTRAVADTARLFDIMSGYETGDASWAPQPAEPFETTAARPPQRLRIAMSTTSPVDTEVDPITIAATVATAKRLAELGHIVEEATPATLRGDLYRQPASLIFTANAALPRMAAGAAYRGRPVTPDDVEATTWLAYQRAINTSLADFMNAQITIQAWSRGIVRFFDTYDLMLTPVLGQRQPTIGTINPMGADPAAEMAKMIPILPFTSVWNHTGQPAISLPMYLGADGLPVGVQLVAAPLADAQLLQVATQLETAFGWNQPLA